MKISSIFVAAQYYCNCQKKIVVNVEDKHFKIECSAIENISQESPLNFANCLKRCGT